MQNEEKLTTLIDSYGLPNDIMFHIPYLKSPDKPLLWSNVHGQKLGTKYCALYCLAYLILKQRRGFDMPMALQTLYPDNSTTRDNSESLHAIFGEHPDVILDRFE